MLKSRGRSDIETIVKDQDLIGRRHGQICDAALKLFSRKGYHQTTVREIAEACGLGIGTLYSYIKAKEDILYLVYRRILETFEGRMLRATQGIQDPRLQLKVALEETLKIYDECEDAVRLLYQESHALGRQGLQGLFEVDRTYVGIFREILERGTRSRPVRGEGAVPSGRLHPVPVRGVGPQAMEPAGLHAGYRHWQPHRPRPERNQRRPPR